MKRIIDVGTGVAKLFELKCNRDYMGAGFIASSEANDKNRHIDNLVGYAKRIVQRQDSMGKTISLDDERDEDSGDFSFHELLTACDPSVLLEARQELGLNAVFDEVNEQSLDLLSNGTKAVTEKICVRCSRRRGQQITKGFIDRVAADAKQEKGSTREMFPFEPLNKERVQSEA